MEQTRTKINTLTIREYEVLKLVSYELTIKEIASELYISIHTVVSHRRNLMSKLGAKNVAGAIRKGFELGYLNAA